MNKIEKIERKADKLKWAGLIAYASMGAVYALVAINTDITENFGLNWETWGYLTTGMPLAFLGTKMQEEAKRIQDRVDRIKRIKSR